MPLDRISNSTYTLLDSSCLVGLDTEDRQINIHATCIQWDRTGEKLFCHAVGQEGRYTCTMH
jgi:hypothetical protein